MEQIDIKRNTISLCGVELALEEKKERKNEGENAIFGPQWFGM